MNLESIKISRIQIIITAVLGLWACLLMSQYYPHYSLYPAVITRFNLVPGSWLVQNGLVILTGLGILALTVARASVMGHFISRFLGLEKEAPELSLGLGLLASAWVVMGVSLLGLSRRWIWLIILVVGGLLWVWLLTRSNRPSFLTKSWWASNLRSGLFWIVGIPVLVSLAIALSPVTESDALRYHSALPSLIHQQGGYFDYPWNSFFRFPALVEMLNVLTTIYPTTVDIGSKLIHWLHLILTLSLMGQIVKRWWPELNPRLAQILLVSVPFVAILSGWAFVEMTLTFYFVLMVYLLLRIRDLAVSDCPDVAGRFKLLAALAVIGGSLVSMKYSMLTVVPFICVLGVWLCRRGLKLPRLVQMSVLALLLGILTSSPFMIRNYVLTGNPVYPMAYGTFGGDMWSQVNAEFYMHHAQSKGGLADIQKLSILDRVVDMVWIPVKASLNPPAYALREVRNNSVLYPVTGLRAFLPDNFGDWQISPFWLIFFPAGLGLLWVQRRNWREWIHTPDFWIFVVAGWYYLTWTQSYRDNRFLLPILPLIAILYARILTSLRNGWTMVLAGILIAYNLLWMGQTTLALHNPLSYLTGRVNDSRYLEQKLPVFPAFEEWNQVAAHSKSNQAAVLCVGEYRPMYLKGQYYVADYFDTPVLIHVLNHSQNLSEVFQRLSELGVTHILYNPHELSLYLPDYSRHFQNQGIYGAEWNGELWNKHMEFVQWLENHKSNVHTIKSQLPPVVESQWMEFTGGASADPRYVALIPLPNPIP